MAVQLADRFGHHPNQAGFQMNESIFKFNKPVIIYTAAASIIAFGLSFFGFLYPWINTVLFWLIVFGAGVMVWRRSEYGIFILALELAIGNKGLLFSIPIGELVLSLRHALFGIVMLAWLIHLLRNRQVRLFATRYRWFYLALGLAVLLGAINGWFRNPPDVWFFDFNAYLFFLIALPLFDSVKNVIQARQLWSWLIGGMLAISVITVGISIIFATVYFKPNIVIATKIDESQLLKLTQIGLSPEQARLAQTTSLPSAKLKLNWSEVTPERPIIYRWLKDTGTAEVSYLGNRIFRVFMSSQVYVIFGLFIGLGALLYQRGWGIKDRWFEITSCLLFGLTLIICFSRSFWLGLLAGFIAQIFLLPRRIAFRFILIILIAAGLLGGIVMLSMPEARLVFTERITSFFRPATEIAASNRLQLLPSITDKIKERPILGSGFGTTVAFKALIPGTTDVEFIKVYLYEWAYLDMTVKIGLIGVIFYLAWLGSILAAAWAARRSVPDQRPMIDGLIAGLIALIALNAFTPYLNHPLGIGLVLFSALTFHLIRQDARPLA